MESAKTITTTHPAFVLKARAVAELFKLRLAFLVVVSAVLGYLTGAATVSGGDLIILCAGGFLLTGGSNGLNQVWERNWDKLMQRTMNRPLPTSRLSINEAVIMSVAAGASGILLLWSINTASGVLGLMAFFMYVFIYTPMKRISGLAVFVGAIPGAIPPMLGYVAATNSYGIEAGSLFAMQFMWQFPHFWAIAWVLHDDYQRAGYQLLPLKEGRTKRSAYIILLYTLFLVPVSLMPWVLPLDAPVTGNIAMVAAVIAGSVMVYYALQLSRTLEIRDARKLMFTSFFYLPVVQVFYWLDKTV
ncbi:MAG: heme o synthase [Flavobacteriales bacterium]|nr:heme o synthase [Flavobacteriales bacterium]